MSENLTHAVTHAIGEAQLHQANADVTAILARFQEERDSRREKSPLGGGTDRSVHARAMHLAQQKLDSLNASMLRSYSMNPPQAWIEVHTKALAELAWERRAD